MTLSISVHVSTLLLTLPEVSLIIPIIVDLERLLSQSLPLLLRFFFPRRPLSPSIHPSSPCGSLWSDLVLFIDDISLKPLFSIV